jgi:phenylpropionate dioxygenase-like ring-hydroxylating dioxygenase large terminal subunit
LYNVCRHRGSLVCREPSGQVKGLVCPYHHWTYKLDGSLLAARHMPEDFDKSQFGLHRAHVKVVEGLIFVSLAEVPADFDTVERDMTSHLKPQGLKEAKICHTRHYEVRANWKLVVENFRECYHCGPAHPEYCQIVGFAAGIDSPRVMAENEALATEKEARWKEMGIDTRHIDFLPNTWHLALRFPLRKGFVSQSLDGKPVAPVMGSYPDRDMGALAVVVYPTFWYESSSDHAMAMSFLPAGPTLTKVDMAWFVHPDAVEGKDYDVDRVTAFWRATGEQDWSICENNQAGVNSDHYQPGPYSPIETDVETFIHWYLDNVSS